MIKEVIHDPIFLAGKSEPATKEDLQVAQDLLDTLIANKDGCVGMAANMIGVRKCIIVFDNEGTYMRCSTQKSLKNQDPTIQRKVVFRSLVVPVRANDIRLSKFNGKPPSSKLELKPSLDGLHK